MLLFPVQQPKTSCVEKVQLEISDVEVSWHETSPARAYYIQMGHRRDGVILRHIFIPSTVPGL